jgi:hypothetical protein
LSRSDASSRDGDASSPPDAAAEVAARLARLEAAAKPLAELPREARVAAVGRVLDAWSDPASPTRRRLLEEHPAASGLSRENVAAGLELALSDWGHDALERLVARELPADAPALAGATAVLHGGVIPMPTLLDGLAPLLLGSPVLAKPAARDPVTPRVLAASLEELAPELAFAFAVADFRRDDAGALTALLEARRVVVTGSDEAVAAVRAHARSDAAVVAHGHKLSVAVLGDDAEARSGLAEAAERLAVDVTLWDQLGCLSPIACWVVGAPARAGAFAEALARALDARGRSVPRGEVERDAAARLASERSEAELRAAAGDGVALLSGEGFDVVLETEARPRAAPLHRFVRVHPVGSLDALADALAPIAPRLAGVAHAGLAEASVERCARGLGVSRAAPFGRLQAPPLDWARDGVGVLSGLLAPP